jgi:hypothetical protein
MVRRRFAFSASWYLSWSLRFVASIFLSSVALLMATGGIFFGRAGITAGVPVFADDGLAALVLTTGALFLGKVP